MSIKEKTTALAYLGEMIGYIQDRYSLSIFDNANIELRRIEGEECVKLFLPNPYSIPLKEVIEAYEEKVFYTDTKLYKKLMALQEELVSSIRIEMADDFDQLFYDGYMEQGFLVSIMSKTRVDAMEKDTMYHLKVSLSEDKATNLSFYIYLEQSCITIKSVIPSEYMLPYTDDSLNIIYSYMIEMFKEYIKERR